MKNDYILSMINDHILSFFKDNMLIIILLIIINHILFSIAMYFILRKEKKNKILGLIPIVNVYEYLKICELPFILFFVPVCNVVMLFLSPLKFANMYRCNKLETFLGFLFPVLLLNYVAFSDMMNKRIIWENRYLPNQASVDALDKKLIDLSNGIVEPPEKEYIFFRKKVTQKDTMKGMTTEEFIDNIENKSLEANKVEDPSRFEEVIEQVEVMEEPKKLDKKVEQSVETMDDINVDATIKSLENIDELEEKAIDKEKMDDGVDKNEYKKYEGTKASDEAIAFGGTARKEQVAASDGNDRDLKCPRCGSSLVGANGFCPGCGMKI